MAKPLPEVIMIKNSDSEEEVYENPFESSDDEWAQLGNIFEPSNKANRVATLPGGIYEFRATMKGWFLEKTHTEFEFPYKVYGNHTHIIDRVKRAWNVLDGNLGILLNGLRGTGKTVTAQLIANYLSQTGIPVLVVKSPIGEALDTILRRVNQDMAVVFDEFEKTHPDTRDQQKLLSAIDGLSRNRFKRLFLFTTNETKMDQNFMDRPSRIRYKWEFESLSEEITENLVDDMLDPGLIHFKDDLMTYLRTRKVCSIDSVKCAIEETNIFREDPSNFSSILNLSESDPPAYKVTILGLGEDGKRTEVWDSYYCPAYIEDTICRAIFDGTKYGRTQMERYSTNNRVYSVHPSGGTANYIQFVAPGEVPGTWIAHLQFPTSKTWRAKYLTHPEYKPHMSNQVWADMRPDGWKDPLSGKLTEEQKEEAIDLLQEGSIYGTNNYLKYLIKIDKVRDNLVRKWDTSTRKDLY